MTPDRQRKAKPTDRSGLYLMVIFILLWTLGHSTKLGNIQDKLDDLSETITAGAPPASGRQQGVSTHECPPVEESDQGAQSEQTQQVTSTLGRLAQSVEQRTFNPRAAHTQRQSATKLGGFPVEFDAIRAPCCARLHVGRVSGGCQERRGR